MAVVGLGVAGSYLLNRLSEQHEVDGYERQPFDRCNAVCAWGTSRHELGKILSPRGISFEQYVLHDGKYMRVDLGEAILEIALTGRATCEQHQLRRGLDKPQRAYVGGPAT